MIRIIVRRTDTSNHGPDGGPTITTYRTFDVEQPMLEALLLRSHNNQYEQHQVVGAELLVLAQEKPGEVKP